MLVGLYGHTSPFKQSLPPEFAPVMGASLLPHKRVPIAVPTALMHRSLIPKLADAGTVPNFWMCLIMARIPKLVCALFAPKARDKKTPSVICKTQQDMNVPSELVWNKLIEMGRRQYSSSCFARTSPRGRVTFLILILILHSQCFLNSNRHFGIEKSISPRRHRPGGLVAYRVHDATSMAID